MASEVRVNKIQSQSGLGTMTLTDGGPEFTGITTITTGNVDGNCLYLKNEEVGLYFGNWGTGSTYPRTSTINATRTDSSTPLPVLRVAGQGGLEFASDLNTVRMSIDSSGRVTSPYQPAFHAYQAGTSTFGWSNSVIVFSSELYDTGGNYDTGNYRFTCPVAGKYIFGTYFTANVGFGNFTWFLRKNGSNFIRLIGAPGYNSPDCKHGSVQVECNANDYFEILGDGTHSGMLQGSLSNGFWGRLLG